MVVMHSWTTPRFSLGDLFLSNCPFPIKPFHTARIHQSDSLHCHNRRPSCLLNRFAVFLGVCKFAGGTTMTTNVSENKL